jgi:GNAT superfamily N-acetyltransferase
MPQHLVELQPWSDLSERLRSEVRSLDISPQQIEYAGSGDAQIRRVETASGNHLVGLAIVHGDQAVGFLVLKRGSEAPDWAEPEAAVISGMRLGAAHQGKGLGRQALLALPAWLCKHWWTKTTSLASRPMRLLALWTLASAFKAGSVGSGT